MTKQDDENQDLNPKHKLRFDKGDVIILLSFALGIAAIYTLVMCLVSYFLFS